MPEPKQVPKEKEEEDNASPPDDIKPIFVATQGQQIFGCVADEDVTSENPYKLISKELILQDFLNRAGVSDFKVAKSVINNYPGEELLLVYDYEFKYGQNFYLCLTEDAKERILHPPKDEDDEEGEGAEGKETEEEVVEIPVTPEPKEWVSQRSDAEIKETVVENTRPLLKFVVTRKRQLFGAPFEFTDCLADANRDMYIDIASQDTQDDDSKDVQKMEMDVSIQAIPVLVDACCQTEWKKPVNAAVQYEAQVMSEEEATTLMSSDGMGDFFKSTCPRVELSLQQNEIMDVFVDDYKALSDTDGIVADKSDSSLKEYQSFTDLKFSKDKPISWIDWHPVQKGIVAVSCMHNYDCDERIELFSKLLLEHSLILIWSFVDPIHPQLFLEAPDDITCFRYNPTNPSIIAGGCINGQVVIWDISTYEEQFMSNKGPSLGDNKGPAANLAVFETDPKLDHAPIVRHVALSSIEFGHKKTIADIQWVPNHIEICSKTFQIYSNSTQMCNQLITCSIDGSVMIWDTRPMKPTGGGMILQQVEPVTSFQHLDLSWKPFLKVSFPRSDNPGEFSATRVSIQERQAVSLTSKITTSTDKTSTDIPRELLEGKTTQFYIGTEDGEIAYCDWKPVKDQESGKLTAPRPDHYFAVHSGAITCLERSPFFKDIILSVGGWTFAIWKEAIKSDALLKSASSVVLLTGGTWSPTRPGVFFITKANGNLEVWDLMDRSHVPYLAQNVSPLSLTTISAFPISNKQLMLGVGDLGGTLHILEVPWSLRHPSSHEVNVMESFFDREVKRLEYVGERYQMRNNQKKELDAAMAGKEQESKKVKEVDNWESKAKSEYEDFLNLENSLLIELGLREVQED